MVLVVSHYFIWHNTLVSLWFKFCHGCPRSWAHEPNLVGLEEASGGVGTKTLELHGVVGLLWGH